VFVILLNTLLGVTFLELKFQLKIAKSQTVKNTFLNEYRLKHVLEWFLSKSNRFIW